jgi:hypothetical protein
MPESTQGIHTKADVRIGDASRRHKSFSVTLRRGVFWRKWDGLDLALLMIATQESKSLGMQNAMEQTPARLQMQRILVIMT